MESSPSCHPFTHLTAHINKHVATVCSQMTESNNPIKYSIAIAHVAVGRNFLNLVVANVIAEFEKSQCSPGLEAVRPPARWTAHILSNHAARWQAPGSNTRLVFASAHSGLSPRPSACPGDCPPAKAGAETGPPSGRFRPRTTSRPSARAASAIASPRGGMCGEAVQQLRGRTRPCGR